MFCTKCGQSLPDGARFCTHCGAPADEIPAVQPVQSPERTPAAVPPSASGNEPILGNQTRRRGLGLMAAAAAAVLALAIIAAAAVGGLFSSDSATVGKAVAKSLNAYSSLSDKMNFLGFLDPIRDREFSQSFSLELKNCQDSTIRMLAGGGVRASSGFSMKNRALDASSTVFFGSADLLTLQMNLADDRLTVYSPELLDGTAVALGTSTLGKDLDRLGADMEELDHLGFNLFDILEAIQAPKPDPSAWKTFKGAIEVKKVGKTSVEINGKQTDCVQYHVVISKDAMKDYINALKDAYQERDLGGAVLDLLRDAGIPRDVLEEIEDDLEMTLNNTDVFDALKELVRELGDLELEVYLSGGYISAVAWEDRIDDIKIEAMLCLGGGSNYADDLSLEVRAGNARFQLESAGDRSGKSGAFTDETTLRVRQGGDIVFTVSSELEYQSKKSSGNFFWSVKGDGFSFQTEGSLSLGKNSMDLELDKCSVKVYDTEVLSLELGLSVGPYSKIPMDVSKTLLLSEASRDDLEDLYWEVNNNAQRWMSRLTTVIPELGYLAYFL